MEYGGASTDQKVGKEIFMENMENENVVTETEAVEVAQEAPKTFTQEDVDRMV